MPLLTPIEQRSISFGTMVANFFISPLMRDKIELQEDYELVSAQTKNPEHSASLDSSDVSASPVPSRRKAFWSNFKNYSFVLFKGALLETLPFDGFDPSTNSYTTADGEFVRRYDSDKLPLSLFLTSLLGIPNRPDSAGKNGKPLLSLKQAFKGWWGGWTGLYNTTYSEISEAVQPVASQAEGEIRDFTEDSKPTTTRTWKPANTKTILQIIPGLIVKFLIILPFKLLTWPFKIALNVAKLFTEALPLFLSNLTAAAIGELAYQNTKMWNTELAPQRKQGPRPRDVTRGTKFAYIAPRVLAIFLLGLVHYSTRIIFLVLRAITSPQQSARQAFYAGRGLRITTTSGGESEPHAVSTTASNVLGFILGSFGALVSFAVSAISWAILFPLTIGAISSFIPQLPVIISNIATLPFIANSLATINGALGPIVALVSNTVGAAFAPVISAMASLIPGLVMSAPIIAVGTTLGILLAPIASISNRIADVFSNFWAAWNPPKHSLTVALDQEVGVNLKACVSRSNGDYALLEARSTSPSDTATNFVETDARSTAESQRAAEFKPTGSGYSVLPKPVLPQTEGASRQFTYGGSFDDE